VTEYSWFGLARLFFVKKFVDSLSFDIKKILAVSLVAILPHGDVELKFAV
jgi:hypothetical protein